MPSPNEAQRALLAEFQAISKAQFERYVDAWAGGQKSLTEFELLFKAELKDCYIGTAYVARGSTDLSQRDYGKIGRRLRDQYGYMHDFFTEISEGKLTPAQIKARANLYAASARQILEEVGNSDDLPLLPHYPGDGSTRCHTNCACGIESEPAENGFDVHWRLNAAEHCGDCVKRSQRVLMVRFGKVVNPEAWS